MNKINSLKNIENLLQKDNVWNRAREKRTSCKEVLSPDRSVKPSIVAKTNYWKYFINIFKTKTTTYKHKT